MKFYATIMRLGGLVGCHQMPERSFFILGYQMPICARCTGICVGYIFAFLLLPLFCIDWTFGGAFCAIMFLDWFVQRIGIQESNNIRRLITGTLCGYGLMSIYIQLVFYLADLITR